MKDFVTIVSTVFIASAVLGASDLAAQVAHQATFARSALPIPHIVHETTRGAFIDPLITEHAFVDRKLRSDFVARLAREAAEGRLYANELVFEYAFTRWFAVEIVQPFLITDPAEGASQFWPG